MDASALVTAPPWGHKPPAVDDHYRYWTEPPPALSPRVEYWLRRLAEGTWTPNRRFRREGYDGRASWLGVYMWEYCNILLPVLTETEQRQQAAAAMRAVSFEQACRNIAAAGLALAETGFAVPAIAQQRPGLVDEGGQQGWLARLFDRMSGRSS